MKKYILMSNLAAFAVCAAFSSFAAETPYAWWKMDEISDSYVVDSSGNGRDLLLGSGCWVTNYADIGKAVFFDGTMQAWGRTTSNVSMPAPGGRTVSMWLYREPTDGPLDPGVNKLPFLFAGLSTFYVNWSNGDQKLLACVGSPARQVSNYVRPARGEWHHVAWTFEVTETADPSNGDNVLCNLVEYLDGAVMRTQNALSIPALDLSYASRFILGNTMSDNQGSRPMFGAVKDVRIFDSALSEGEIIEQYAADRRAFAPQLIGIWPMEEFGVTDDEKTVVAQVARLDAELTSGEGVQLVDGGVDGKCAYFPNLLTAWMNFKIPRATAGFSVGMWMKFGTNLVELESGDVNNRFPHLFSIGGYGRAALEGDFRGMTDNRCHFYDVETFDNVNAQGFMCPCITPQKGEWGHVGVTYEMAEAEGKDGYAVTPKIYVDGVCVCTGRTQYASTLTGVYAKDLAMCIGNIGADNFGTRPFGGWIDDFCYVDGVLDEAGMADLARGLPTVDAGDDFTVAKETARLDGTIGRTGTRGNGPAARVKIEWSLVSAPAGGETAAFLRADDLRATVSLPVIGDYVFRLTAKTDFGLSRSDEVAITRVAPAGSAAPTVSVSGAGEAAAGLPSAFTAAASPDDARVSWKCVSGPGAVRFEPAWGRETEATFFVAGDYEIAAVASDGGHETVSESKTVVVAASDAIDFENGLLAYWPFDLAKCDKVRGTAFVAGRGIDGADNAFFKTKGADAYAVQVVGGASSNEVNGAWRFKGPGLDTGFKNFIDETPMTPEGASYPTVTDRWRSISCWIYHDSADANGSYNAVIAGAACSWGLWYRCQGGDNGFTMYQQSLLDGQTTLEFACPAVNPADRWTHLYAVFDRNTKDTDGNASALWIDGVKQVPTAGRLGRSRATGDPLMIGGHDTSAWAGGAANNGYFIVDGVLRPRTFPGAIDEVRVYDRVLTDAEIAYLAANPVVSLTRPPAVGGEPASVRAVKRQPTEISVSVDTDGYPAGAEPTYRWYVVSGDASGLTFADPTARATTVTGVKTGSYVLQLAVSDGERTVYSAPVPFELEKAGLVIRLK